MVGVTSPYRKMTGGPPEFSGAQLLNLRNRLLARIMQVRSEEK